MLKTMFLNIGDRVLVDQCKGATLRYRDMIISHAVYLCNDQNDIRRYCGTVDFAAGVWVGVELDTPEGKNDGIIQDTIYFKCSPQHGACRKRSR